MAEWSEYYEENMIDIEVATQNLSELKDFFIAM